jgi:hypothetical protein
MTSHSLFYNKKRLPLEHFGSRHYSRYTSDTAWIHHSGVWAPPLSSSRAFSDVVIAPLKLLAKKLGILCYLTPKNPNDTKKMTVRIFVHKPCLFLSVLAHHSPECRPILSLTPLYSLTPRYILDSTILALSLIKHSSLSRLSDNLSPTKSSNAFGQAVNSISTPPSFQSIVVRRRYNGQ